MGASTSRIDEDKALQLCRERKKFVQQALDGRCLLAAAHVSYVQSLKSTGTALRKFAETEVPVESSLYTSTSATPDQPLALTEKSVSHLSYSPPLASHSHHDTYSPPPSPPSTSPFQVNHMKFRGFSSKKVEEKPPVSIVATVTSSSIPQSRSMEKMESTPLEESSSMPPETPPWDYFGLSHPIDNQFSSSHVGNGHVSRSVKGEDETPDMEEDGENFSFQEREESRDSDDDEFDEPTSDTLVRSFENFNRVRRDHSALPQREGVESEFSDAEKSKTPELSPPVTPLPATPGNKTPNKGDHTENKLPPRDFLSSMKEIELLFVKASETGKEVPRMLEANKLHFRPIVPSKESNNFNLMKAGLHIYACTESSLLVGIHI